LWKVISVIKVLTTYSCILKLAQINYRRFLPTGTASLTVTNPQLVEDVQNSLRQATISEYFLKSDISYSNPLNNLTKVRNRGIKGKEETAMRETLTGDGYGAGIAERGRSVVVWGLPKQATRVQVLEMLKKHEGLPVIPLHAVALVPSRYISFIDTLDAVTCNNLSEIMA
jgi:hypothetical protein